MEIGFRVVLRFRVCVCVCVILRIASACLSLRRGVCRVFLRLYDVPEP